jgi:hypothetical protein
MYGLKAPKINRPRCRLARLAYTGFIHRGSGAPGDKLMWEGGAAGSSVVRQVWERLEGGKTLASIALRLGIPESPPRKSAFLR